MTSPDPVEFVPLAQRYPMLPVWRDLPAGPDPVAVFRALGTAEGSMLVELPGGRAVVGLDPVTVAVVHGGTVIWTTGPVAGMPEGASLVEILGAVLGAPPTPDPPPGPLVGAFCVLGGDALRERPPPASELPDSALVFPGTLVVFDPSRLRLVAPVWVDPAGDPETQYAEAVARLDDVAGRLAAVAPLEPGRIPELVRDPTFGSEVPDGAYREMIVAAHRRVVAGEARQVTVSRRFAAPAVADPLDVHRVLRAANPSPYHFLLRLPGVTLVGASPQGLVGVHGRRVSAPVIAGTRRRGADPAADAALAAELLADPKERDEHAMLVELTRADLAGVARPGTVRVADGAPEVRRYARVMHLVSDVTGTLAEGRTAVDALAAVFPGGTVTGTPRAAALRLIDEIEPRPRGLYGGGVGLVGPEVLELCLGIRTLQFHDGTAYCQAGAGVVADSVPDREVRESRDKASALFAALETAGSWPEPEAARSESRNRYDAPGGLPVSGLRS